MQSEAEGDLELESDTELQAEWDSNHLGRYMMGSINILIHLRNLNYLRDCHFHRRICCLPSSPTSPKTKIVWYIVENTYLPYDRISSLRMRTRITSLLLTGPSTFPHNCLARGSRSGYKFGNSCIGVWIAASIPGGWRQCYSGMLLVSIDRIGYLTES